MAKEIETESAGTNNPVDAIKAGLAEVLKKYAVPDPKIVSVLPKGGVKLDFVAFFMNQKPESVILVFYCTWLSHFFKSFFYGLGFLCQHNLHRLSNLQL